MSLHSLAGARTNVVMLSRRLAVGIKPMSRRSTSWMAFEQPNPAIYRALAPSQPKRPTVGTDAIVDKTPPTNVVVVTTASAAATKPTGTITPTKPTGQVPTVQKRSLTTGARMLGQVGAAEAPHEPEASEQPTEPELSRAEAPNEPKTGEAPAAPSNSTGPGKFYNKDSTLGSPTLRLRLRGQPATWPVSESEYPMTRKQFIEWIEEGELISKGLLPRC